MRVAVGGNNRDQRSGAAQPHAVLLRHHARHRLLVVDRPPPQRRRADVRVAGGTWREQQHPAANGPSRSTAQGITSYEVMTSNYRAAWSEARRRWPQTTTGSRPTPPRWRRPSGSIKPTIADTIPLHAYADNWCAISINGKLVATDSIDRLPHNQISVKILREYPLTLVVLAKDNADPATGLEYGNRIGDGGRRAHPRACDWRHPLAPEAYTFRIAGAGGTTGVALAEVYALP